MSRYTTQTQTPSQTQKKVLFDLTSSKHVVCSIKGDFPGAEKKHAYSEVVIVVAVTESVFNGKKYLWARVRSGNPEKFNAPIGALVRFTFRSGSARRTYHYYTAYFKVVEGAKKTITLKNQAIHGDPNETVNVELTNLEPIKVPDAVELDTMIKNDGYAISKTKSELNELAYIALKFTGIKPEEKKEEEEKSVFSETVAKLEKLAKELEEEEEEAKEEAKVTKEDVYRYLESKGLVPVKLVTFDLPTEYKGARTEYEKTQDGKVIEKKTFTVDPTKYRSLRRKFYYVLERSAFKTTAGWVLTSRANLKELNNIISELNKLAGTYRNIWIIETYMPKDYVEHQLEQYIRSRELALKEIEQKLQLEKLKESQKKQLQRRLEELSEVVKALREELRKLRR